MFSLYAAPALGPISISGRIVLAATFHVLIVCFNTVVRLTNSLPLSRRVPHFQEQAFTENSWTASNTSSGRGKETTPNEVPNWKESKPFEAQVMKFVEVIEKSIQMLESNEGNEDELLLLLYEIGRKHQKFSKRGFRSDHWHCFRHSLNDIAILEAKKCDGLTKIEKIEVTEAWNKLTSFIVTAMEKGYMTRGPKYDSNSTLCTATESTC
ncbi:unnamed protein product [Soboliphyme baturini]|uniref:GLOBIN domain-containing protein n=1 Tax=Soboliphyme baturini TaxID=241478 RepID=A0A183IWV9_9BILA|nr:unnamed protein product [Soboliphyme baturini]